MLTPTITETRRLSPHRSSAPQPRARRVVIAGERAITTYSHAVPCLRDLGRERNLAASE